MPISVFDTLFTAEIAATTIFFLFFGFYDATREKKQHIPSHEIRLLAITMTLMVILIGAFGVGLFFEYSYANDLTNPYLTPLFVGLAIGGAWFSMLLLLIQAFFIYRRLRKKGLEPSTGK